MEIKTFDTILTQMCDEFDLLIAPKKIARSNTNIIYLLFKAIAKGYELINNVCVVLSNKFNPAKCSDEDLVSVASLVGTERRTGSASGLHIVVSNPSETQKTLLTGIYVYELDDDTSFEFEVVDDVDISAGESVSYIAMSNNIGQYPVTAQQEIKVKSEQAIDSDLVFSCTNNSTLLGNPEESLLAFRKRILNTYDRQNGMIELEEYIRNLPYIFDCKVKYNQSTEDITVDGLVIPPMTCAIFISGEIKNELAELVCDHIICPTVSTADSTEVRYENDIFADGYYAVNLIPFDKLLYTIDIIYHINNEYVNIYDAKEALQKALMQAFVGERYVSAVKEDDIYNVIETTDYTGIDVLAINLKVDGVQVDFVDVPVTKIAELSSVNFVEG